LDKVKEKTEIQQREFVELAADQGRLAGLVRQIIATSSRTPTDGTDRPDDATDRELDKALQEAGIPGFSEN
jgi:hypothetical protein